MAQGLLPFQYESNPDGPTLTGLAGLLLYLELSALIRLPDIIRERLNLRPTQGFTDVQQVMALVMLNLAGGECLEDLKQLEADTGFTVVLGEVEIHNLRAAEREKLASRFRAGNQGVLPSPDAASNYLEEFHDAEQEALREPHKAFVPQPNAALEQLEQLPSDIVSYAQWSQPQTVATLDQDATLGRTQKREALFCYQHYKAFQPLNMWWAEHRMVLYSEFRDGNCPAGWRNLDVLKRGIKLLPPGVREVRFRGDSAAYEVELMKFCAEGKSDYGVIKFAISADVTESFRTAVAQLKEDDWQTYFAKDGLNTGQQWAEVCYVPNWAGYSKNAPEYRFIAIREPMHQLDLPTLEPDQEDLPFPVAQFGGQRFKLFGIVTNQARTDMTGNEVIRWHRERCGKSEEAHSIMKSDLAGGQFPSGLFGANAAWWQIMLIAFNLNVLMQRHILGGQWTVRRLKGIRFALISVPGRVTHHGRRTLIQLPPAHPALDTILAARNRMLKMANGPPAKWLLAA